MNTFFLAVILFAAGLALLLNVSDTPRTRRTSKPYKAKPFMNATETTAFFRLKAALAGQPFDIHAQVALSSMLDIDARTDRAGFNRVNQKSIDFVITRIDGTLKALSVVAAIELDGSSHDSKRRKAQDAAKDAILREAGIRIIRWTVRDMPTIAEIRRQLL